MQTTIVIVSFAFAVLLLSSHAMPTEEVAKAYETFKIIFPNTKSAANLQFLQDTAEYEADSLPMNNSSDRTFYDKNKATLIVVPKAIAYDFQTIDDALKASLETRDFLTYWISETATDFGIYWQIGAEELNETPKMIQFFIAITTRLSSWQLESLGLRRFRAECLKIHNEVRKRHQADVLVVLSEKEENLIYPDAAPIQKHVDELIETNSDEHDEEASSQFAENMEKICSKGAIAFAETAAEETFALWYSTKSNYDFKNPNLDAYYTFAGFTEMIWSSTQHMSAGMSYGQNENDDNTAIIACRYYLTGYRFAHRGELTVSDFISNCKEEVKEDEEK